MAPPTQSAQESSPAAPLPQSAQEASPAAPPPVAKPTWRQRLGWPRPAGATGELDARRHGNRLAVPIFVATLLGSFLGVLADFDAAAGGIDRVRAFFQPPLTIQIFGSSTILGDDLQFAAALKADFEARNPGFALAINDSGGTENGVEPVLDRLDRGEVAILASSEPHTMLPDLAAKLAARGARFGCAALIGYDVIAVVTHPKVEVENVPIIGRSPSVGLNDILAGRVTNWNAFDNGPDEPIRILARRGSGTTRIVLERVAGLAGLDRPPTAIECRTLNGEPCQGNDDYLTVALNTPGALYWVSSAWLRAQRDQYPGSQLYLRTLPLGQGAAELDPLSDTFNPESYPAELIRPLYLYVFVNNNIAPGDASFDGARRFIGYVRDLEGQTIVQNYFFYNAISAPRDGIDAPLPAVPDGSGLSFGDVNADGAPIVCAGP